MSSNCFIKVVTHMERRRRRRKLNFRGGLFVFFLMAVWGISSVSYSQNQNSRAEVRTITGTVVAVDWVGEKLVVDTNDYGNADEVTFVVPKDAVLTRGTETIGLSDVEEEDQVQVEFSNSLVGLMVRRLNDMNKGNAE